ncbi:hypothetical protein ANN_00933 [Periplaneta americana]|uniref:Uncharacterized protein n=1 Tax=Periplaneta americana TaxID=6978 RepID=A0ABQ8TS68_PERAM|nr:hypothetical protein ANN_00933 [Periplaneta americana]
MRTRGKGEQGGEAKKIKGNRKETRGREEKQKEGTENKRNRKRTRRIKGQQEEHKESKGDSRFEPKEQREACRRLLFPVEWLREKQTDCLPKDSARRCERLQISGRQHSLKCAKGKRCRPVCTVVQQEEIESILASNYECTITIQANISSQEMLINSENTSKNKSAKVIKKTTSDSAATSMYENNIDQENVVHKVTERNNNKYYPILISQKYQMNFGLML